MRQAHPHLWHYGLVFTAVSCFFFAGCAPRISQPPSPLVERKAPEKRSDLDKRERAESLARTALSSPDPKIVAEALLEMSTILSSAKDLRNLLSITPDYAGAVLKHLDSTDQTVLYHALRSAPTALVDESRREELESKLDGILLEHPDEGARYLAIEGRGLKEKTLIRALGDTSAAVKIGGLKHVETYGKYHGPRPGRPNPEDKKGAVYSALQKLRQDSHPFVRARALVESAKWCELYNLNQDGLVAEAAILLNSDEPFLRASALEALGHCEGENVLALIETQNNDSAKLSPGLTYLSLLGRQESVMAESPSGGTVGQVAAHARQVVIQKDASQLAALQSQALVKTALSSKDPRVLADTLKAMSTVFDRHNAYPTSQSATYTATPDYVSAVLRNLGSSNDTVLYHALNCAPAAFWHKGWESVKDELDPFRKKELREKLDHILLEHPHEGARYLATLKGQYTPSDDVLIAMLNDSSPAVRNAGLNSLVVSRYLGKKPSEEKKKAAVYSALQKASQDSHPAVKGPALVQLAKWNRHNFHELKNVVAEAAIMLKSEEPFLRASALDALAFCEGAEVVDLISSQLDDKTKPSFQFTYLSLLDQHNVKIELQYWRTVNQGAVVALRKVTQGQNYEGPELHLESGFGDDDGKILAVQVEQAKRWYEVYRKSPLSR